MSPKQTLSQLPRPLPAPARAWPSLCYELGAGGEGWLQIGTNAKLKVPRARPQPEVVGGQGLRRGQLLPFLIQRH